MSTLPQEENWVPISIAEVNMEHVLACSLAVCRECNISYEDFIGLEVLLFIYNRIVLFNSAWRISRAPPS